MMAHVDLCSGIGGFALGFEWAGLSKPVLFCDIEPWSRKVLAKHWPDVPIAEDVKELANDPDGLIPDCDILTAGYPCQPFSVAGKQKGAEDDRHIWPEIFKIIQAKRPTWIVCENVSGHISLGLDQVLSDLEDKAGYAVQTFCVGAVSVNAPHRRQRIWIIAHTNSHGEPNGTINEQRLVADTTGSRLQKHGYGQSKNACQRGKAVADTDSSRQQQSHKEMAGRSSEQFDSGSFQSREDVADTSSGQCKRGSQKQIYGQRNLSEQLGRGGEDAHRGWAVEPPVGRVAHGIPGRVDRLKGLGNAIVPQIAMQIGLTIKAVEADDAEE